MEALEDIARIHQSDMAQEGQDVLKVCVQAMLIHVTTSKFKDYGCEFPKSRARGWEAAAF